MRFLPRNPRLFIMCLAFSLISFLIIIPTEWTLGFIRNFNIINFTDNVKATVPTRFCHLKHHFVFLKVHKAGSTTVMNALQRFGLKRNLNFVLPKAGHYLGKLSTLDSKIIMPLKENDTYNILCNHAVYNRKAFRKILRRPMFYFAILRSPFDQFISAFYYYTHVYPNAYLLKVPGDNPITEYLKNPFKYETLLKDQRFSYTDNRMAFDLGLGLPNMRNETNISEYIKILDEDFHYVMIMEYFEISMVLLKRHLCWELKDVLYIPKNIYSNKITYKFSVDDFKRHREWAKADYMIYEYFLQEFWKKVQEEGPDLVLEINHYRSLLTMTRNFCTFSRQKAILIPRSEWNGEFELTFKDCDYMKMGEMQFVSMLQEKQRKDYISY